MGNSGLSSHSDRRKILRQGNQKVADISNSATNSESAISEAFRSPSSETCAAKNDGLRLSIHDDRPLTVTQIRPTGWAAFWGWFFPNATVVELSGRLNVALRIFPSHVQIEKRRWFSSSSVLARFDISIPVYDEIGDAAKHQLRVRSALAFLYPFVPMHVEVSLDDDVVFSQGKFEG